MSLSSNDSLIVEHRTDILNSRENEILTGIIRDIFDWGVDGSVPVARDDRAAELEAALIRYTVASRV